MVIDIIDVLMDLEMEPKPESLWWTSAYPAEDGMTLDVRRRKRSWEMPFVEISDTLGNRFRRNGRVFNGQVVHKRKGWGVGGGMHTSIRRTVPMRTECERVVSQVFSTGLNGSVNWPWSVGSGQQGSKNMINRDREDDLQTEDEGWRGMGGRQDKTFKGDEGQVEEDETIFDGRESCG